MASCLASSSKGLLQLVAPVTLYPPLPNPSHGTSYQCGNIRLRSRLQLSIRGCRRLRLMYHPVLPLPTSTLGCNTTWVNLHQPPSPASYLELLYRNVLRPGTLVDGWAEVRHGPRNSHDRARKVLTDWRTSRQKMLPHTQTKNSYQSSCAHSPWGSFLKPRIYLTTVFLILSTTSQGKSGTQKKDERKRRDGRRKAEGFFLHSLSWQKKTRVDEWENCVSAYVF